MFADTSAQREGVSSTIAYRSTPTLIYQLMWNAYLHIYISLKEAKDTLTNTLTNTHTHTQTHTHIYIYNNDNTFCLVFYAVQTSALCVTISTKLPK